MIDFANYTPSPSREALATPALLGDVGKDNFNMMMMHLFPGVMSSALLSLIVLAAFIIALPLVIWIIESGRIKNEDSK